MPSIPRRPVSGRYRGRSGRFEVELRIDVDGWRSTRRVSADYAVAATGEPVGSMRLEAPAITTTRSQMVIRGNASFTWSTPLRQIQITIPRAAGDAPATATLRHLGPGGAGAEYRCSFDAPWFRTALLGEAVQRGVTKLDSYDTGTLASGGPARPLSYVGAFAEAGIEMQSTGPPSIVDTAAAGPDVAWSDAELQAAMEQHFAQWIGYPRWAVWLMHATRHDDLGLSGPHDGALQGLMFDRRQRQGCAVFYDIMPGTSPAGVRDQLYTCVHEIAHGFNLRHSWEQSNSRPPVPSRPDAASWMNYPSAFPGGKPAFWKAFAFEFDHDELVHLRHAFRDDIIMGATPFDAGAALVDAPAANAPGADDPGLRLTLNMAQSFDYGVPVTADLELSVTASDGRRVQTVLGPRSGNADVVIAPAGGTPYVFEPLLRHCRGGDGVVRRPGDPPVRDAALLHYGQDGHPFAQPGLYDVQARHTSLDGVSVFSDVTRIRVLAPRSAAEREIGRLTYGDEQTGILLSLMGSDAPALRRGNEALQRIIARHPRHPMAAIARLVGGANAARAFKAVAPDAPLSIRPAAPGVARALIDPVIDVVELDRVAASIPPEVGRREALAIALARVGTRPGVSSAVAAFLRTRIGEMAAAVPVVAAAAQESRRAAEFIPPDEPPPTKVAEGLRRIPTPPHRPPISHRRASDTATPQRPDPDNGRHGAS